MFKTLNRLFESKKQKDEEAILIHLDGVNLEESIYAQYDASTLEKQLADALGTAGEVDGNEIREKETVIFLYGNDAENMFTKIEPVLASYPLCKNARVVIRQGKPGATQREVQL